MFTTGTRFSAVSRNHMRFLASFLLFRDVCATSPWSKMPPYNSGNPIFCFASFFGEVSFPVHTQIRVHLRFGDKDIRSMIFLPSQYFLQTIFYVTNLKIVTWYWYILIDVLFVLRTYICTHCNVSRLPALDYEHSTLFT